MREFRKNGLSNWCKLLVPGGRLIIADVPASGELSESYPSDMNSELPKAFQVGIERMAMQLSTLFSEPKINPEPARFFDEFVADNGSVGHQASYESKDSLHNLMVDAGFQNVHSSVISTPWMFRSIIDALWFFHELFGIGNNPVLAPELMSEVIASAVEKALKSYLGIVELPDGGCLVGWKLLYVWGDRSA